MSTSLAFTPPLAWPPYPPSNETQDQMRIRLEEEVEARRISDSIDRTISAEREQIKKRGPGVKLLLLGQAESGKSTILKNFQLYFAPKAFAAEAIAWCPVIYLNLVRSVNFILNVLEESNNKAPRESAKSLRMVQESLRRHFIRLAPLKQVEDSLIKNLIGAGAIISANNADAVRYHPAKAPEVAVRSGSGWKGFFKAKRQSDTDTARHVDDSNRRILAACTDNIIDLWNDPPVRKCLAESDIVLEDQAGFFLEDVKRLTKEDYLPTSSDILRARMATIGPEEHHIQVECQSPDGAQHWTIYDVGGSRSQRATWAQFFDDVNVIIFLAPISAFNQVLAEDPTVNRLSDSLRLWQQICSNKILASIEFILFLNKLDILDVKLRAGIKLARYFSSYGERANDTKTVTKYLVDVFVARHKQHSPKRRKLYPHLTCATDTVATSVIINRIQEQILVKVLSQTNIL
ncbi:hypothetical protein AMATHDRAFT_60909 [Amanita thiersii Skay4041]|uniref:G-alpha-domain-containing protein n=1 Tax=Amanita thiersii Skay4041 TaxID=703135 RepID=A0A2A9NQH9_9AGAR|nr:hypothetical protein AMATHDRAFT_60909 [Amanita thiersii Skay4041]